MKRFIYILAAIATLMNAGSSYADFKLSPHLSFIERYNDNINNTADNKRQSFSSVLSPGADIGIITRRMNINLGHTTGYESYYRYPELNNLSHNTTLSVLANPNPKSVINVSNSFNISESSNTETNYTGVRNSFIRERQRRVFNNLEAASSYTLGERLVLKGNLMAYYEDVNVAVEYDEKRGRFGGGVTYNVSEQDAFDIDVSYTLYRFKENDISFRDERGFNTSSINSGYTHRFKTGAFSLSAGGNMNNYLKRSIKDETVFVMGVSANKNYDHLETGISYSRNVNSGGGFGGGVLEQTYNLNISFASSEKLTISLNGAYSSNKFFDTTGISSINNNKVYRGGISTRYNIATWCTIEAGYNLSFYKYNSNAVNGPLNYNYGESYGGANFTFRNGVGINITYRYLNRSMEDKDIVIRNEEYVTNIVNLSLTYRASML